MFLEKDLTEEDRRFLRVLEERTSINSVTGCWEYLGTNSDGYGQVTIDYKFYYVHRLAARIFLKYDLDSDLFTCHKPECPKKNCWNPEHLYIGTAADNNADIKRAGTGRGKYSDVTHCVHGHEFTEENTYWAQRATGEWRRMCRECRRINDQKRKAKMRMVKFGEVG